MRCPRCGAKLEKADPTDVHCGVTRASSRCYRCKYLNETAEGYYECRWKAIAPRKCPICGYEEKLMEGAPLCDLCRMIGVETRMEPYVTKFGQRWKCPKCATVRWPKRKVT